VYEGAALESRAQARRHLPLTAEALADGRKARGVAENAAGASLGDARRVRRPLEVIQRWSSERKR